MMKPDLASALTLPVVVAPMFLVSGPELVIAACRAGIVGSFPALNARTSAICANWLQDIEDALAHARAAGEAPAPYAINLILRDTERLESDLSLAERFRVPIVISSVGNPAAIVDRVHGYGGIVLHDVASVRHAEKAIAAKVDGLILLTAGAGGHTGDANPFAFVRAVRRFWDGLLLVAGGISDGASISAVEMLGADLAYMGTRFSATHEAEASASYKNFLLEQRMADVITTDRITGLPATFMRGSIAAAGLDPDTLPPRRAVFEPDLPAAIKAWRDVWSAGHGVEMIDDIPTVAELVSRLTDEYRYARRAVDRRELLSEKQLIYRA